MVRVKASAKTWPWNMCKMFSPIPSKKNLSQEKTAKNQVFTFQKKPFGTWQYAKIGVMVNFFVQKLKSKHLVCLSLLWWQVFWGSERKYFTHNLGLGGNASLVVSRVNAHSLSIQSTAALLDVWTLPSWPGVANFNKLEVSVVNENLALCPSLNL